MVTRYEKLDSRHYRVSANHRGDCLAEIIFVVGESGLPVEYHIHRYYSSYLDFRYWISCVLALSFNNIKKFAKDELDGKSMPDLFR